MTECRNCKSVTWAAKNDEYCTDCEQEYIANLRLVLARSPETASPYQGLADAIIEGHRKIA